MDEVESVAVTVRPRACVFDWDNTLVDSWDVIHAALNRTLVEFGLSAWTADEVRGRVRKSMRESFPALFGDRWEEAGEFFLRAFAEVHLDRLTPLVGAETLLTTLQSLAIPAAVVSNKTGALLRDEVEHLGWQGFFSRVIGALDAAQDKPAIDPVLAALEPTGIEPGLAVWFVGDTDVDLECAKNAGCTGVLVRPEPPSMDEFKACRPHIYFSDCLSLCKFVQNL